MKIDTSKFKKVDCDESCTTLAHPSGHEIRIAHKGLSPELKKTLDEIPVSFAKGGRAKFAQAYDPSINKKGARPSQVAQSSNKMPGSPTMAVKAYTEPQDAGPDVVLAALNKKAPPFGPMGTDEKQHYPPCINPSCKSFGRSHPNCRCYGGGPEKEGQFAEGGKVESYCSTKQPHRQGCEYFYEGGGASKWMSESNDPEQPHYLPELQATPGAKEELAGTPPEQFNMTAPENLVQPDINPNPEIQESKVAEAPAPEEVPTEDVPEVPERAPAVSPESPPVNNALEHAQQVTSEHLAEDQAVKNDLAAGYIKPEHYEDQFGKGTLGKIGTMFGLLLSGAGSGLSGQPNMVMEMMNNAIKNDLQAKEKSADAMQNVIKTGQTGEIAKATVKKLGSETRAQNAATNNMLKNRFALDYLIKKTANIPADSPEGMKRDTMLSILSQMVDKENATIASKEGLASALTNFGFGNQGTSQNTMGMKSGIMGPQMQKMGEDIEEKTIPGVPEISGQRASRPIPQASRDQALAMTTLENKAKDLISYAKAHEGSWNPKTRAIAQQKAEEMIGFYGSSLGVSGTQGNRIWLEEQIAKKNPTSVIAQELYGSNSRLKEIADSNTMRKKVLLNSLGFKTKGGSPAQSQGSQPAQSKSGREIIYKNGKAYYK